MTVQCRQTRPIGRLAVIHPVKRVEQWHDIYFLIDVDCCGRHQLMIYSVDDSCQGQKLHPVADTQCDTRLCRLLVTRCVFQSVRNVKTLDVLIYLLIYLFVLLTCLFTYWFTYSLTSRLTLQKNAYAETKTMTHTVGVVVGVVYVLKWSKRFQLNIFWVQQEIKFSE